ncbi:MAG TPA: dTDP-4-dehydrorhamnose reductase, partial [Bdellovibrio sp.]|nr:dTDP-4-dehydrorhamnose reductase [Bdellovibrio sp.]
MILVIGKNGQLAQAFQKYLSGEVAFWGRDKIQQIQSEILLSELRSLRPDIIINTAAYTAVDKAETEVDQARELNVFLPTILSQYAEESEIPLVHFSTDYVFDGSGTKPWTEDDTPHPVNIYGQTKYEGESALLTSGAPILLFRTSWVYSEYGNNFVKTILKLAQEKESLRIVDDQVGSPTYACDLAQKISEKMKDVIKNPKTLRGIYHIAGRGYISWYEFAVAIVEEAQSLGWKFKIKDISPIASSEYKTAATRPLNSRLSQEKLHRVLGIEMPFWRDSLKQCL